MAGNGPAPKDPAARRRRNTSVGKTLLPANGRTGATPAWPLLKFGATRAAAGVSARAAVEKREAALWARLWKSPQAVAWQRDGSELDVAMYVRHMVSAEGGDMKAAAEARQWSDRLGLNPKAMRSLLWEVAGDEVAERRDSRATTSRTAAKRRDLKIVG